MPKKKNRMYFDIKTCSNVLITLGLLLLTGTNFNINFRVLDLVGINFSDFEILIRMNVAMNLILVSTIFNEKFTKIAKLNTHNP